MTALQPRYPAYDSVLPWALMQTPASWADEEKMPSPADMFIHEYKVASGEGATLELKMRMLADKVPAIDAYVRLEDVEEQIVAILGNHLQPGEAEMLRLCRQLRNKILHCDFHAARSKLHALGATPQSGGARRLQLDDSNILEQLLRGVSDPAASQLVSDMTSTQSAGIFGWLLELGSAGYFRQAIDVFRKAAEVVDRICAAADGV